MKDKHRLVIAIGCVVIPLTTLVLALAPEQSVDAARLRAGVTHLGERLGAGLGIVAADIGDECRVCADFSPAGNDL